jgi:hypothetical protein
MANMDITSQINAMIALELSDQDLASFRLVCHATNDAVDDERNYFWRQRFNQYYDATHPSRNAAAMKILYQGRRGWQRRAPCFSSGNLKIEKTCLHVIKSIIIGKDTSCSPRSTVRLLELLHRYCGRPDLPLSSNRSQCIVCCDTLQSFLMLLSHVISCVTSANVNYS